MASLNDAAAQIRERTSRKLARGRVTIPLPIREGTVAAVYGVLSRERIAEFTETPDAGLTDEEKVDELCDFIAGACRGMKVKLAADAAWEPLEHDNGDPVGFDKAFAEAFELDLSEPSAAAVVRACFTTEDGQVMSVALNSLVIRLVNFSRDTTAEIEGEVAGG